MYCSLDRERYLLGNGQANQYILTRHAIKRFVRDDNKKKTHIAFHLTNLLIILSMFELALHIHNVKYAKYLRTI